MSVIPLCFWCHKPRTLTPPGPGDNLRVVDYIPCRDCGATFRAGVWIIETQDGADVPERPPITATAVPTGRWMVVTHEAVARWRDGPQAVGWEARALASGRVLMDRRAYESLIGKGADDGSPH